MLNKVNRRVNRRETETEERGGEPFVVQSGFVRTRDVFYTFVRVAARRMSELVVWLVNVMETQLGLFVLFADRFSSVFGIICEPKVRIQRNS